MSSDERRCFMVVGALAIVVADLRGCGDGGGSGGLGCDGGGGGFGCGGFNGSHLLQIHVFPFEDLKFDPLLPLPPQQAPPKFIVTLSQALDCSSRRKEQFSPYGHPFSV
ncbi:unnamed protein product [Fraxinus pennsylvanica]|uniref:Secreted protein n=1 Tax=Fraxinus pennsylvanica TaxID=56036 RepID=A0AAD1YX12_9LAMI|nr:unnamed protein product [Fraxinus pennsylvanica]